MDDGAGAGDAVGLAAQMLRERWFGEDLTAEIKRTLAAYEAGSIHQQELSDWVGSWLARAKRQDDPTV